MKIIQNRMATDIYKIKMAMISAASKAIEYKDKNPKAEEQEIMQHVSDLSDKILDMIEKGEG